MHGSWTAPLKVFEHEPSVVAPQRGRVVEPADRSGRAAADVVVLLLAERNDRLVRRRRVGVAEIRPRSRAGGQGAGVVTGRDRCNGTVIGNRPHGTPGAHSVVIVPVTAVAWVVAVKVDRPMARAKYVPKLRDALARTPARPSGTRIPTVPDHVSLEVGVLGRRDRHVVVGGRSVDRLADLEVPGVAGRGRAGPDGSGRRAAAHQVLGDDDGPGLGNRVGSILRGPLLGQRVATVDNEGDSGDQGDAARRRR